MVEALRHKELLSEIDVEHPDSAAVFQDCREVFPFLESLVSLFIMLRFNSLHEFQSQMHVEAQLLLPDGKSSFLFFLGLLVHNMPDSVDWVCFEVVAILLVPLILFPCVEHLRLESITVGEYGHIIVLMTSIQGLESLVIPLVDGNFLLIFSQFVNNHVKRLQFLMTILIKLGIFNELFEGCLFAVANALLQIPENYLGDD